MDLYHFTAALGLLLLATALLLASQRGKMACLICSAASFGVAALTAIGAVQT